MTIDPSLFKSIDFTNKDNLLFLVIFLAIALIIFFIIFTIVFEIIRMIKRAIIRIFNLDVQRPKFDKKESTNWLHQSHVSKEANAPEPKIIIIGEQKSKDEKQDEAKSYKEKEEKSISEHLGELKTGQGGEKDSLESKMPSRTDKPEDNNYEQIKIPTPKRFSLGGARPASPTVSQDKENTLSSSSNIGVPTQKIEQNKGSDSSIFQGGSEVSRIKLEHEMRADPKVWQAAKQEGLTLSPIERAKLVKEVFSPLLGRNISKTDLKSSIRKLNQKMLGTKDDAEHAKIRKEIKFFKKIGGIKN